MKNYTFLFIMLLTGFISNAQEGIQYGVRGNYFKAITKEQLKSVQTLSDIDSMYRANWVSSYVSTEIVTIIDCMEMRATGNNDTLSAAQLKNLAQVDIGSDIILNVRYYPENNLKINDQHEMDFTVTVAPDVAAKFPGGFEKINEYFADNDLDDIIKSIGDKLTTTAIHFNISEEGKVANVQLAQSSGEKETDMLLLEVIRKMPTWKPAETSDGKKVKQEFKFDFGFLHGCPKNLIALYTKV